MPAFVLEWMLRTSNLLGQAEVSSESGPVLETRPIEHVPDYQPYIFWAYGLACLLLFLFMVFTVVQIRSLSANVQRLEERLRDVSSSPKSD